MRTGPCQITPPIASPREAADVDPNRWRGAGVEGRHHRQRWSWSGGDADQRFHDEQPGVAREAQCRNPDGADGPADEIAKVVAFLASDAANYITATSIFADGGIMQSSPGLSRATLTSSFGLQFCILCLAEHGWSGRPQLQRCDGSGVRQLDQVRQSLSIAILIVLIWGRVHHRAVM